mmetsp:Transcript_21486/g.57773  ORF Transcript_21486/g.57773 Transcript_21486/m.57773 type:complete len:716 (-) Transcript_21486:388-2535(-)
MIYYTSSEANFWRVFLIWYGSVIPRALPQACLSAGLACLYEMLGVAGSRGDLIEHPYVVHILGLVLGYLLVQRSQLAYQRWWEARTSIAQMTGKWTDAITQLVEFEHISPLPDARHFRARMVHLGSLLHAVAFADLREDWKYTDTSAATLADDDPFGLALIRVKREGGGGPGGVRAGLQDGGPATDRDLSHNGSRCAASPGPKDAEAPAPLPFTHLRHTARAKYDTRRDSRRGGERSLGAQRKRSGLSPWRFTATAVLHLYDPVAYGQQALANPFGIIGGLGRGERRALAGSHSRDRVQQVQTWLLSLVVKRHADGGLPVPAPILSRSYQVLSDGHLGYMQARKVGDTPFPFPYVQLATLLLHAFNLLAPLVIAANITTALDAHALAGVGDAGDGNVGASGAPGAGRGGGLALMAALSFFATLGYTALNQVARELEEPFGHGPNHLPLAQFQDECNAKLVQLLCRDAGAPVPDDPFLGDEAEGLSEEAKAELRAQFGLLGATGTTPGRHADPGGAGGGGGSGGGMALVGIQEALDHTFRAHEANLTSRAQLSRGMGEGDEDQGHMRLVSVGGLQTGVAGAQGLRPLTSPRKRALASGSLEGAGTSGDEHDHVRPGRASKAASAEDWMGGAQRQTQHASRDGSPVTAIAGGATTRMSRLSIPSTKHAAPATAGNDCGGGHDVSGSAASNSSPTTATPPAGYPPPLRRPVLGVDSVP